MRSSNQTEYSSAITNKLWWTSFLQRENCSAWYTDLQGFVLAMLFALGEDWKVVKSHFQHCLTFKKKSFWSSLKAWLLRQHLHTSQRHIRTFQWQLQNSVTYHKCSLSSAYNPADLFWIYSGMSSKCETPNVGNILIFPKGKYREGFLLPLLLYCYLHLRLPSN